MSILKNKCLIYSVFRVTNLRFKQVKFYSLNRNIVSANRQDKVQNILELTTVKHHKCISSTSTYLANNLKSVSSKVLDLKSNVDKLVYELSSEINNKQRIYKSDFMKLLSYIYELKYITPQHFSLMLSCCTNVMPEITQDERTKLLEEIWTTVGSFYTFSVNNYNELLKCHKENKHKFKANVFLDLMKPVKPNNHTYYNLIAAVCEVGDVNQAQEILSNMKAANIPITEECFNSLIEGYGYARDFNAAKSVLETMNAMMMERSSETQISLMKAAAFCNELSYLDACLKEIVKKPLVFNENQVMDLVKYVCDINLKKYIPMILSILPKEIWNETLASSSINAACVQLIHNGQPEVAYDIFTKFPVPSYSANEDKYLYFRKLLRECVKAAIPWDIIKYISADLVKTERNLFAFQIVYEAALQTYNPTLANLTLKEMKEREMPLRPHYFWPLFIYHAKESGENGVFDTITLMNDLNVVPDFETLVEYIIPHINIESAQTAIKKLQSHDLNISTTLVPMMYAKLKENKLQDASDLCEIYPHKLDCERIIFPLINAFYQTRNLESLSIILEAIIERPVNDKKDWIGWFLVMFLSTRRHVTDFEMLEQILTYLNKKNVFISQFAADICTTLVSNSKLSIEGKERVKDILYTLVDRNVLLEVDMFDQNIQHPKEMNLMQLEAHLIELESKQLNTRGVLRKLLQEYCRLGMKGEAKTILKKCESIEMNLSAGMLANVVDLYVKCEDLEFAEKYFHDLQKIAENFHFDEHKVIDFVTLLAGNNKFQNVIQILENYARKFRILGGPKIESNCWKFLDTIAKSKNYGETENFFSLLCRLGFCKPSNILLGPLIRCHLYKADLFGAVDQFVNIAKKFRKTPLKHELLCRLLKLAYDETTEGQTIVLGKPKKELSKEYIKNVLDCDKKIHGAPASQLSLIIALADSGLKKPLRKYLLDPSVSINSTLISKQCERLGTENKLEALEILAECLTGLRNINTDNIYEIILNIHCLNSDCNLAMNLWIKMQENGVKPSKKFVNVFSGLLKSHKYDLPHDLIGYLDSNRKSDMLENY